MNKEKICSNNNAKIKDYKSLTNSQDVPDGNKRYKKIWKEFICNIDGPSMVKEKKKEKKKKEKIYNLDEFAKLVRKIKKFEKVKSEKEILKENDEKLAKFRAKLAEYCGEEILIPGTHIKEPKIKNSLDIVVEKVDENYAFNYLKLLFPEYYKNEELINAIRLMRKRKKEKINSNIFITNLIQTVLEEFSDKKKMNFGELKIKIDAAIDTFIVSETKIKEKQLKKKSEEDEIYKLTLEITKDIKKNIFCTDLNACIDGNGKSNEKLGFLPLDTRLLLENESPEGPADYFFRLKTIGDGNCLVHAILQLIDPEYPQCDNLEGLELKKKKYVLNILNTNRKKYVANFRKYLGNSINQEVFDYLGNKNEFESLNHYKNYISTDKKWLDKSDIPMIASFLNVNIFLFTYSEGDDMPTNPVCIENLNFREDRPTILIYNVYETHYESIIRIRRNSPILLEKTIDDYTIKENSQFLFDMNDRILNILKNKYLLDCNNIIQHMFIKNWNKSHCDELGMESANDQGFCSSEKPYRKEFIENDAVCCSENEDEGFQHHVKPDSVLWYESPNKDKMIEESIKNSLLLNLTTIKETIGEETVEKFGEQKVIDLIDNGLDVQNIIELILNSNNNSDSDSDSSNGKSEDSDEEITECDITFEGKTISVEIHSDDSIWYKFKDNTVFTKVGKIIYTSSDKGKAVWDSNYRDLILAEN